MKSITTGTITIARAESLDETNAMREVANGPLPTVRVKRIWYDQIDMAVKVELDIKRPSNDEIIRHMRRKRGKS